MFTSCKSEATGISFNFNKGYLTQWVWNNGNNQVNGTKIDSLIAVKYSLTYGCNITTLTLEIIGDSSNLVYSINGTDYQKSQVFSSLANGTINLRIKSGSNILTIPIIVFNNGTHCLEPVFEQIVILPLICLSDDPIFQTLNIAGC